VPIGYIYAQLSNQSIPADIWPSIEWKDITKRYSGLYFRAEGNQSKGFAKGIQSENSRRLVSIRWTQTKDRPLKTKRVEVKAGLWSPYLVLGLYRNGFDSTAIRVKTSADAVRPVSSDMWVWKVVKHLDMKITMHNMTKVNDTLEYLTKIKSKLGDYIAKQLYYM
jgi:hypothetical protein